MIKYRGSLPTRLLNYGMWIEVAKIFHIIKHFRNLKNKSIDAKKLLS